MKTLRLYMLAGRFARNCPRWHLRRHTLATTRAACLAKGFNPADTPRKGPNTPELRIEATYLSNREAGIAKLMTYTLRVTSVKTEQADWRKVKRRNEAIRMGLDLT